MDTTDSVNLAGSHRFWPSASGMTLILALGIAGLLGLIVTLASGEWIATLLFAALLAYSVFSFGWLDIEPGRITQGRLIGGRSVEAAEVHSMKLDFVRSKSTKWWFPVLILHTGEEVKLATVKSVSKKKTIQKASLIQGVLNGTSMSVMDNAAASGALPGQPQAQQPVPEDVFTPLPGLEQHYNS